MFEDVSSDKVRACLQRCLLHVPFFFFGPDVLICLVAMLGQAEAIMTLAGSNGRSWSTVYSPQSKPGMPVSVSEGLLSTFERERAEGGSKPSSMTAFENSLGVSTEIHDALSSLLHKTKWTIDMQTIAGRFAWPLFP